MLVISKWDCYLGSKREEAKNGSCTKETPTKEAPDIIRLTFRFLSCIFLLNQVNLTPDNGLLCHIGVNVKIKPQVHSGDQAPYFSDNCLGPYTFQNFKYILCNKLRIFSFLPLWFSDVFDRSLSLVIVNIWLSIIASRYF